MRIWTLKPDYSINKIHFELPIVWLSKIKKKILATALYKNVLAQVNRDFWIFEIVFS